MEPGSTGNAAPFCFLSSGLVIFFGLISRAPFNFRSEIMYCVLKAEGFMYIEIDSMHGPISLKLHHMLGSINSIFFFLSEAEINNIET